MIWARTLLCVAVCVLTLTFLPQASALDIGSIAVVYSQNRLNGVTAGYAVDFVTIIILYTTATALLWTWFHGSEGSARADNEGEESLLPVTSELPTLVEHA